MTSPMTGPRPPALWFAIAVVFIDALAMSVIIPIMPALLRTLSGYDTGSAALIGGLLAALYGVMQFGFGALIGAASDRFGRRPLILIAMAAMSIDHLIMGFAPSLWLLFVGRALAGLAGASYTVASAYIADISPKEKRAANFGLIGAAFGIGFVLGPSLGGWIAGFGLRAPFFLAAALSGAACIIGLFILPESLPPEKRRAFAPQWPHRAFGRFFGHRLVGPLLWSELFTNLALFIYPAIWAFWSGHVFGWSPAQIGLSLACYGIGAALVQAVILPLLLPILGPYRTALLGLVSNSIGLLGCGLATSGWMIYAILPIAALGNLAVATMSGMIANQLPDQEQGELQGVITALGALASIVATLIATGLFALTANILPGAPFLLACALSLIALAILLRQSSEIPG